MTSSQICTRAAAIAKFKGSTAVAGQYLNTVLQELCQSHDFDVCRGTYNFTLNSNTVATNNFTNVVAGSGPYALPADYLRMPPEEFLWYLNGEPYPMMAVDMSEFDKLTQQSGLQSYPTLFVTDGSTSPNTAVIYPPISGSVPAMIRYYRTMADIGSNAAAQGSWVPGNTPPETATVVPWFPSSTYLYTRVAGELMKESSDTRWQAFLGDEDESKDPPGSAMSILRRFLRMANDYEDRSKTVKLDRRRFSIPSGRLSDTKKVYG